MSQSLILFGMYKCYNRVLTRFNGVINIAHWNVPSLFGYIMENVKHNFTSYARLSNLPNVYISFLTIKSMQLWHQNETVSK